MMYCLLIFLHLLLPRDNVAEATKQGLTKLPEQMAIEVFFRENILNEIKHDTLISYVFESDLKRANFFVSDSTVGITRMGSLRHNIATGLDYHRDYIARVDKVENIKLDSTNFFATVNCKEYYSDSFEGNAHYISVKNHLTDGTDYIVQLALSHRLNVESELKVFIFLDSDMNFLKYYRKVSSTPSRRFRQCDR